MEQTELKKHLEAILFTAEQSLSINQLINFFPEQAHINKSAVQQALSALNNDYTNRGVHLQQTNQGYRFQTQADSNHYVSQHWQEKPSRYSRALLETLAIIVYRQPITRAEIEDIRGVSVSSSIIKTLEERQWVRILGHKEVPGRPALWGSSTTFLDDFNLRSLNDLPPLSEIKDFDQLILEINQNLADKT
ncbi:MAG TPA: SMC-Scp complex subunit ScpB [Thiothrix sp.]|nr:SMC-Scp complex subunit ScpB [Thiothrix sp.]